MLERQRELLQRSEFGLRIRVIFRNNEQAC
jgi:hypothetical protein